MGFLGLRHTARTLKAMTGGIDTERRHRIRYPVALGIELQTYNTERNQPEGPVLLAIVTNASRGGLSLTLFGSDIDHFRKPQDQPKAVVISFLRDSLDSALGTQICTVRWQQPHSQRPHAIELGVALADSSPPGHVLRHIRRSLPTRLSPARLVAAAIVAGFAVLVALGLPVLSMRQGHQDMLTEFRQIMAQLSYRTQAIDRLSNELASKRDQLHRCQTQLAALNEEK